MMKKYRRFILNISSIDKDSLFTGVKCNQFLMTKTPNVYQLFANYIFSNYKYMIYRALCEYIAVPSGPQTKKQKPL
jgi:hypothetical protein